MAEGLDQGWTCFLVTCYPGRKEPEACLTCSAATVNSLLVSQRGKGGMPVS